MTYTIIQRPWKYPSANGQATYYKDMNRPIGVVIHKMQGYVRTILDWADRGEYGKSWHYSITLKGIIYKHLEHRHGGYHAGISFDQGNNKPPTWPLWKGPWENVNIYSIGIELEGFSGNEIPTEQMGALQWLLGVIIDEEPQIKLERVYLPSHSDIDRVNRVNDFDYPDMREDAYQVLLQTVEDEDEMSAAHIEMLEEVYRRTGGDAGKGFNLLANHNDLNLEVLRHGALLGGHGIDAVVSEDTKDLFMPGSIVGTTQRIKGKPALDYAMRKGFSVFLGLSGLNTALMNLQEAVKAATFSDDIAVREAVAEWLRKAADEVDWTPE